MNPKRTNPKRTNPKKMVLKRIIEIVETYGSRSESWPIEERESAIEFIKDHPEAEDYRVRQQILDFALDEIEISKIDINALSSHILAKIELDQITFIDRALSWIFPVKPLSLWQPAVAAALPITIGIFLGLQLAVVDTDDQWDQEFYLNSFSNINFDFSSNNLNEGKLNESNSEEIGND